MTLSTSVPASPFGPVASRSTASDPDPFPLARIEIERLDDLLGSGELVVMVQLRRPRRRPRVVDDEQEPAGGDGISAEPQHPRTV